MKKTKVVMFGFVSLLAISLSVGHVFAAYAVTDNADSFEVTIRTTAAPRTITFHMPNVEDNSCLTYSTTEVEVEYGDTLNDISTPSTASFLGFSFSGWYQEATYENPFSPSTNIENDIDLYPKFTRSNVLYNGSSYYLSSNNDQIVDGQFIYKINQQIWGVSPTINDEIKIDLHSASGIYKMTYNSEWTILRKVGLNAKDCSWWGNDNYDSYVYCTTEDHSSWTDKWWGSTPSTGVYVNSSDHQKAEVYIDYSFTYLGVIRVAPGVTLSLGDEEGTHPTNSTSQTSLSGYNKNEIYLYWSSDNVVPTWGTGD